MFPLKLTLRDRDVSIQRLKLKPYYSLYFFKNLRIREYSAHHCELIRIGEYKQLTAFSLIILFILTYKKEFSHSLILEIK